MSNSLNTVTISGNLARDPETKVFASSSVTEFTVAVSDYFKPKEGEAQEKTYWIRCKCWNKKGEAIANYFKKGSKIGVSGKIVQDEWEKDGVKQSKTMIEVEDFVFMDSNKQGNGGQSSAARPQGKPVSQPDADLDAPDDGSVPF